MSVQPIYQFKCNLHASYSIIRPLEESNTHRTCSLARDKFDDRRNFIGGVSGRPRKRQTYDRKYSSNSLLSPSTPAP